MTNKQPSKQEIIDAIKKKADKVKQANQRKSNSNFSSSIKNEPTQPTFIKPKQHVESRDVQIVKQITKPSIESRISNIIDNRCRYWIENRISQLLSSDNFTTREGYSFSIDNDRSSAGLCFRFTKNGTTLAKIDSNGYLYCANVFSNGTNLLAIAKFINDINSNSSIYVKHTQLKDGTYVMDIDELTANEVKINSTKRNPLIINNASSQQFVDVKLGNSLLEYDKTNQIINVGTIAKPTCLQVSATSTTVNEPLNVFDSTEGIRQNIVKWGYNSTGRNNGFLGHYYSSNDSVFNYSSIGLTNGSLLKFFDSYSEFSDSLYLRNQMYQLRPSLTVNQLVHHMFGKSSSTYESGVLSFKLGNPTSQSIVSLTLNGMSGIDVHADYTESKTPFHCPSLYVNGSLIDVDHIAYTNMANTFTEPQEISTDSSADPILKITSQRVSSFTHAIEILAPNLSQYSGIGILIGKRLYNNYGFLKYRFHDDDATIGDYIGMGIGGYGDLFRVYVSKTVIEKALTVNDRQYINTTNDIDYILNIESQRDASFVHCVECLAPNLTANHKCIGVECGKSKSAANIAYFGYRYSGTDASVDSYAMIGLYSYDDLLRVYSSRIEMEKQFKVNLPSGQAVCSILNPTTTGGWTYLEIGKSQALNERAAFCYWHSTDNNTDLNNRLVLYMNGENLECYQDRTILHKPLTINGDLTITGNLYSTNTAGDTFWLLRPSNSPGNKWIAIGSSATTYNRVGIGFRYVGDGSNDNAACIWHGTDILKCYPNRVELTKPTTIKGNTSITGTLTIGPIINCMKIWMENEYAHLGYTSNPYIEFPSINGVDVCRINKRTEINANNAGDTCLSINKSSNSSNNEYAIKSLFPNHRWGHVIRFGQSDENCNNLEYETYSSGSSGSNQFRITMNTSSNKVSTPIRITSPFSSASDTTDTIAITGRTTIHQSSSGHVTPLSIINPGSGIRTHLCVGHSPQTTDQCLALYFDYDSTLSNPISRWEIWGNSGFYVKTSESGTNTPFVAHGGMTNWGSLVNNGDITVSGSVAIATNYSCSGMMWCHNLSYDNMWQNSDKRLKDNIKELEYDESKQVINDFKAYSFNYKNDEQQRTHYGTIAQDLIETNPELVHDDNSENHMLGVNYIELIPHLINVVKRQQQEIDELKAMMKNFIQSQNNEFNTEAA